MTYNFFKERYQLAEYYYRKALSINQLSPLLMCHLAVVQKKNNKVNITNIYKRLFLIYFLKCHLSTHKEKNPKLCLFPRRKFIKKKNGLFSWLY